MPAVVQPSALKQARSTGNIVISELLLKKTAACSFQPPMASLSFLATLLVCLAGLILFAIQFYFLKTRQPEQISLACTGKLKLTK